MYKCGDFIIIRNQYGRKECFKISMINAVYYDNDLSCYTILFSDGQEVLVEVSISDGEKLITTLC